ncbi:MAG TPA: GNAT family N-acetyltransferase [Bryobacteraceae bacterium]|nr:GNAT family N-acetyltransferase [Bryobacteraceae bacterium]
MGEIRIRPATWHDLPHILHHRRAMFAEMGCPDEEALDRMQSAAEQYMRVALPNGTYQAWMAEADTAQVIGGGGIAIVPWPGSPDFPAARRGWILGIYTEPPFRRQGVARQIMDTIVEWCRAEGFAHVSLHASQHGRQLYETMGFQPTNEMRLYLK